ncbi:MAG TPA: phosphotransferase family protein [Acidimicrobiales bacterium]|nr:phosphotransferase family protein [Acidimicrobiales bacterium]
MAEPTPNEVTGVDVAPVTDWFRANIDGVVPPLTFELIAGGRSNLTFKVDDAGGHTYVLRRPPTSHVLPTAHDMGREHRIISALADTPVPVAPALGFCDDPEVNGQPFYVMGYVDGHILRDGTTAAKVLDESRRRAAGESLVEVLAAIHAVDPDAVGLGELGRKEGYIERQLKRWNGQFEQSKSRDIPVMDDVFAFLSSHVPEQQGAAIVHGDYRLDNTMLGDDGQVKAVLDWEICTLGDPLADVGLLMVYWADPDDAHQALGLSPTTLPGFPRRSEIVRLYEARSDRDLSQLNFYVAFGYWKLACILEGVFARYSGGAMGGDRSGFEGFGEQVVRLAEQARAAADRV